VRVVGAAFLAAGLLVVPLASAASFGRSAEIPLVRAPTAVVDLDVTQDGTADLVLANAKGPTLTVLPGKEGGRFGAPFDIGVGTSSGSFAVADFDNNGSDDLAVAGGGQIAIYMSSGGSLVRRSTLTTSATTVIAADLDLDGNDDLVAASASRPVVTVFLGTDEGTFLPGQDFATSGTTAALFAADVNGDELPDIVAGGNGVSLLLGNGDGTLAPPVSIVDASGVAAITGSDFDGDGAVDLALARAPNIVDVLHNDGNGSFASGTSYRVGGTPTAIGFMFADADSEEDLVTANRGTSDLSILHGLEDGQFGPEERIKVGKAPVAFTVEDLNGDGLDDLVTANRLGKSVTVLLNGADAPQPVVCLVPGVARRKLAVAHRLVTAANCRVAAVQRRFSGRVRKGRVISIAPVPGTRRPVGTPVTLLVSRGPKKR
jgi:hypothetical protein